MKNFLAILMMSLTLGANVAGACDSGSCDRVELGGVKLACVDGANCVKPQIATLASL